MSRRGLDLLYSAGVGSLLGLLVASFMPVWVIYSLAETEEGGRVGVGQNRTLWGAREVMPTQGDNPLFYPVEKSVLNRNFVLAGVALAVGALGGALTLFVRDRQRLLGSAGVGSVLGLLGASFLPLWGVTLIFESWGAGESQTLWGVVRVMLTGGSGLRNKPGAVRFDDENFVLTGIALGLGAASGALIHVLRNRSPRPKDTAPVA